MESKIGIEELSVLISNSIRNSINPCDMTSVVFLYSSLHPTTSRMYLQNALRKSLLDLDQYVHVAVENCYSLYLKTVDVPETPAEFLRAFEKISGDKTTRQIDLAIQHSMLIENMERLYLSHTEAYNLPNITDRDTEGIIMEYLVGENMGREKRKSNPDYFKNIQAIAKKCIDPVISFSSIKHIVRTLDQTQKDNLIFLMELNLKTGQEIQIFRRLLIKEEASIQRKMAFRKRKGSR